MPVKRRLPSLKFVTSVQKSDNCHQLIYETHTRTNEIKIALLSDLHWDNPDCDRRLLKKDLDYCLKNNIRVILNGDTFCLMQGKYDPRGSKSKVRPEHQKDDYADAIVMSAVEWFTPYAEIIDVVGYGNHETAFLKRHEVDLLKRFVTMLNLVAKPVNPVYLGGYTGMVEIILRRTSNNSNSSASASFKILYFHGSGGGGIVTRGEINLTRMMAMYEGFDCYTMGHIHELKTTTVTKLIPSKTGELKQKNILMAVTSTYKDEYKSGKGGWHVERGAPPKPLGGLIMSIQFHDKPSVIEIKASTSEFPL